MARRTKKTTPKATPKRDEDYTVIWDNRGHIITDDEWREWVKAGCPLTEQEQAEHREPRKPAPRDEHGKRIPARPKRVVQYHRNGKPVKPSVNKLSTIAYHFTRGIKSAESPRLTTTEFRALLAKAGIAEPETTEWTIDLGNGNVISATMPRGEETS